MFEREIANETSFNQPRFFKSINILSWNHKKLEQLNSWCFCQCKEGLDSSTVLLRFAPLCRSLSICLTGFSIQTWLSLKARSIKVSEFIFSSVTISPQALLLTLSKLLALGYSLLDLGDVSGLAMREKRTVYISLSLLMHCPQFHKMSIYAVRSSFRLKACLVDTEVSVYCGPQHSAYQCASQP